jgi:restriction endonuclease Mrr
MASDQDRYGEALLTLILDVASLTEFPKLRGIEDEEKKVAEAKGAVAALRRLAEPYEKEMLERERTRGQFEKARADEQRKRSFERRLAELKSRYEELAVMEDAQARGRSLEPLLRDLFVLFDLDPRAAFVLVGEQIDGSFTLGETHFLLEVKWTKEPVARAELDPFKVKVTSRIENTLGLFISINGFQPTAVEFHSGAGSQMLLMTGTDLYLVLDNRVDLVELLKRKHRHASQTGEVLFEATEIA